MGEGARSGRNQRRHLQRSAWYRAHAAGYCWLHRSGNREHHWTQSVRSPLDPR